MKARLFTALFFALQICCSNAVAQSSRDLGWAEQNRFQGSVAVWYGSHLETTGIHDWEPIKKWNGPFHPLLGDYKTGSRKVIRKHLQWLRRAGVDVIFYDAVRVEPEQTLFDLPKQKTLSAKCEMGFNRFFEPDFDVSLMFMTSAVM